MHFSVRNVVGIGSALFLLAVGFLVVAEGHQAAAVLDAFWSLSLAAKLAWVIVVLVPLVVLPYAVWLGWAAQSLELRLDGVRQGAKALAKPQLDSEAAVHHLVRTDPEDAIGALRQRLTEAERFAQVQESRNEIGDLSARVDEVRARQQALQQRLAPVLEKRRSIEQLFLELDGRQNDIGRTLAELSHGDDAVALDVGLKKMMEFVGHSHARCDDIERAAKVIAGLKEDFAGLQTRLAPLAAAEDGVARRVKDLSTTRDKLAADIDAVLQTPAGPLAEQVQKFADDKKTLDGRLSEMNEQFSRLATLREDIAGLSAGFERALGELALGGHGTGAGDADARVEELTTFIKATQAQLDEIERRLTSFLQLKTKLGDLQARLVPLEAEDGGVVSLVGELKDIRDRLAAKIKRMEESEDGDLGERVQKFTETRRELEERVSTLTDQVLKLATIRRDIAGLFDKLSSAASAS